MSAARKLISAVHTPFDPHGDLNLNAVEAQAELLIESGVAGVFPGGTTGESLSLTMEERLALAKRWVDAASGTLVATFGWEQDAPEDEWRSIQGLALLDGDAWVSNATGDEVFRLRVVEGRFDLDRGRLVCWCHRVLLTIRTARSMDSASRIILDHFDRPSESRRVCSPPSPPRRSRGSLQTVKPQRRRFCCRRGEAA